MNIDYCIAIIERALDICSVEKEYTPQEKLDAFLYTRNLLQDEAYKRGVAESTLIELLRNLKGLTE